jgi:hypothetical protein
VVPARFSILILSPSLAGLHVTRAKPQYHVSQRKYLKPVISLPFTFLYLSMVLVSVVVLFWIDSIWYSFNLFLSLQGWFYLPLPSRLRLILIVLKIIKSLLMVIHINLLRLLSFSLLVSTLRQSVIAKFTELHCRKASAMPLT